MTQHVAQPGAQSAPQTPSNTAPQRRKRSDSDSGFTINFEPEDLELVRAAAVFTGKQSVEEFTRDAAVAAAKAARDNYQASSNGNRRAKA